MRSTLALFTTKFVSIFCAATLALGLVPAAAFAAEDNPMEEESSQNVISSEVGEADEVEGADPIEPNEAEGLTDSYGEAETVDEETGSNDSNLSIPAALERINEDVALTQPVAQQESTRSYFLAQTLESTKTVPIVSANLPLDKGTSSDIVEPDAEGEGSSSENEEDNDSEDDPASDDPVDASFTLASYENDSAVSAESTVIGSFTYLGITYAVEPGGETVAAVASDYSKIPESSVEKNTIVLPPTVTTDYIDYYSVTRIADYAFANLTLETAATRVISTEASERERSGEISPEEEADETVGITILGIPSSITSIGDEAFAGFNTLQYIVVEEGNPTYASYDGALYSADLTNLRLIPEGRVGTVRVAPSATTVDSEVFSHCPSVDTVVADPESEVYASIGNTFANNSIALEAVPARQFESEVSAYALDFADGLHAVMNTSPESSLGERSLYDANGYGITYQLPITVTTAGGTSSSFTYASTPWYSDFYDAVLSDDFTSSDTLTSTKQIAYGVDGIGLLHDRLITRLATNNGYYYAATRMRGYSGIELVYWTGYTTTGSGTVKGMYSYPRNPVDNGPLDINSWLLPMNDGLTIRTFIPREAAPPAAFRTVYYDPNGGKFKGSESQTSEDIGLEFTLTTTTPTRDGYSFAGWEVDEDCHYRWLSGGPVAGSKYAMSGKMRTASDIILTAQWTADTYKISLDENASDAVAGTTPIYQQYAGGWYSDSLATSPLFSFKAPTRTGYYFKGYRKSNQTEATYWTTTTKRVTTLYTSAVANTTFTEDTTLYAVWAVESYAITLNKNTEDAGSSASSPSTIYLWYGKGWYRNRSSSTSAPYTSVTSFTVPKRTGYIFKGYGNYDYSTSASYFTPSSDVATSVTLPTTYTTFTGDKTLYAVWSAKTSDLTFDLQDGSWKSGETLQDKTTATYGSAMPGICRKNTTIAMSVPEKTGCTFAGFYDNTQSNSDANMYYTDALGSHQDWNKNTTSGTILYAWWTGKRALLEFDLDGGKGGGTLTGQTATYGQAMPTTGMSIPTKDGYEFQGYFTAKNCGGTKYYEPSYYDKDAGYYRVASANNWAVDTTSKTTLYAGWKAGQVSITWNANGGKWSDGKSTHSGSQTCDDNLALEAAPSQAGYSFAGWFTDATGGTEKKSTDKVPTSATTYYAHWNKLGNVTVSLKNDKTDKVIDTAYAWPEVGLVLGESSKELVSKTNKTYLTTSADGWKFKGYYDGTTQMIDANGKITEEGLKAKPGSATVWTSGWDKLDAIPISLVNDKTNKTVDTAYYWPQKGIVLSKDSQTFANTTNKTYAKAEFEGYNFTGYYSNGTQMIDGDGHLTQAGLNAAPSEPIEWTSGWDLKKFTVTWKFNAASGKADVVKMDVPYGSGVAMIPNAENPGYNFAGWALSYQNGSTAEAPNVFGIDEKYTMKDKGNVVFTETWNRSPYTTVNLVDDYFEDPNAAGTVYHWPGQGYVTSEDSTDVKKVDAQIVTGLPDMTDYGYQFLGWYSTNVQTDNSDDKLMIDRYGNLKTGNQPTTTTWYAHWTRTDCPVNLVASYVPYSAETAFEIENGDAYFKKIPHAFFGVEFSNSVENGKLTEVQLPKRIGYTFMGYYTQKNAEVSVADAAEGRFAGTQWIAADGTLSTNKWNETPAKTEDFVLYAAWRLDDCAVIFDASGNVNGVLSDVEQVTVMSAPSGTIWNYGKPKKNIPVPSESTFYRNGYEFGGWYYLKDANGSDVESNRIFVSDAKGNPVPVNWDAVKTSVTLYPFWTAKKYKIMFWSNYPPIPGEELGLDHYEEADVLYDQELDLSDFTPKFPPYAFEGWYTMTDQLFEGTHMTVNSDGTKRFTPRGMYASQSEIELFALWSKPSESTYTLFWKIPGDSEIKQSVHTYEFTDTIKFNGTEAPVAPAGSGYRFEGWVEVDSYETALRTLGSDAPYMEGETIDGFKPLSFWKRYFVAKWNTRAFSVAFSTAYTDPCEDGTSWLMPADLLDDWKDEDGDEGSGLSWSEACKLAAQKDSDMSTGITYDATMPSFILPDVKRKGQTFLGWKLLDENGTPIGDPVRGIKVDPSSQDVQGMRDLVYVPVFKDAVYTIVLDANTYGEEQRFEGDAAIPYSGEFTFPYPATLHTGSVFVCWAADTNTVSTGTYKAYPTSTVKLAPTYDEYGDMTEFGLALLADESNVITLHAVWNNASYHVDVPLFANLAIDTDRGDVIAGTNTIAPDPENADTDAIYRIESIRYEPLTNDEGVYAFQREGDPTDKVYLSVYAGLNTGEATDLEHLLYAENVGEGGELTYTDAANQTAKASPLLIELGGTTPVVYGRTAPENQASLESVTDADAPYGFVTFSAKNPLTIRYGLFFENDQSRKDFAFNGKYQWLLPANDGANKKTEFVNTEDEDYGRGNAWSGNTVDVAKLHYTVSLVNTAK